MDEREVVLAAFRGENAGRHAWYGDLSYWLSALEQQGCLENKYKGDEGQLRFYQDFEVGIGFYAPNTWKATLPADVEYLETQSGNTRKKEYRTAKGNIFSIEKYLPASFTWAFTEHCIKTIEDLRIYTDIMERTTYTENYEEYSKIDKLWGESGIAVALAPEGSSPLQRLLARIAGVDTTYYLYADHTDEIEQLMQRMQEAQRPIFEILANSPSQIVEFPDNYSAEVTGRTFFELYNKPFYQSVNEILHKGGKYTSIHNDGTVRATLDLLPSCGFDCVEAVTPKPVGDIEVNEIRDIAGDELVIWGGIPGALFSSVYSDEMFEAQLKSLSEAFRNDNRFVFGVADQVPPDAKADRVKLVRQYANGK